MNRTGRTALRRAGPLLAVWLAACSQGLALGDYVGIEPQYWVQGMTGTVRADSDAVGGTEFDLQDDLDLDKSDNLVAARVWVRWLKRNYLIGTMFDSKRTGEQTLGSDLVFNGTTYGAGETVRSRIDAGLTSVVYGYNFLDLKVVKLGFRVGADRLDFEGTLRSAASGTTRSSESVTFPVAGLGLTVQPVPQLRFTAEAAGLGARVSGNDVSFVDGRVQVEVYPIHFLGIHAGYRVLRIDVDLEDFGSGDVEQKGPYLGLTFRI